MTELASARQEQASAAYAWYVVVLLTMAYVLSYLDRWVLSLLVEYIKADLGLSDTEMGLLGGTAFAIFYATMGIPLGWLADRYSRRNIAVVGIALWSLATAAAGLARNFAQLFVARMAVGVGEASLSPCALSLITDYFSPGRRGRAIAFYTGAVSIGSALAALAGGLLLAWAEGLGELRLPGVGLIRPWQLVFIVVGLPGVLVAALMLTVREPRRTGASASGELGEGRVGFPRAFGYILSRWRCFGGIFGSMSVITVLAYSHFWLPPLFARTWGWDIAKFSVYNGVGLLLIGPASVNFAGWLADYINGRGRTDGPALVLIFGVLIMVPASLVFPLMPSGEAAFGVYLITVVGAAFSTAAAPAAIVSVAPGQIRSQAIAVFYLTISLTGLVLGPSSVAFFTDVVFADENAIRYSMALVPVTFGILGLAPVLVLAPAYRRELAALASQADSAH